MFIRYACAAVSLLAIVTIALVGCQTQSSSRLPQPMPQPIPQPPAIPQPIPSIPTIPQPIPSPPTVPRFPSPPTIPVVLPTGESSSHGCYVSREHPVADNVEQYLLPVHQQLAGWAGQITTNLRVPDHRIEVYGQEETPCVVMGTGRIQHIGLTPPDNPSADVLQQKSSHYIYQYAHELAHVLANYEEGGGHRFGWFGETLSELASLHVMRANGRHGYANSVLGKYTADRAEISDFDATGRVSDWYPYAIVHLGQNSTFRELNGAIACELLPYFESDPTLWEAVTHIDKWSAKSDDFRSYLDSWAGELASRGLPSNAPEFVRAVLYGEGDVRDPLPVCSLIAALVSEEGEGAGGDPEEALRESMEGYDQEIAQERSTMAASGQGMAAGSTIPAMESPGGAMVTIPSEPINTGGGSVGDAKVGVEVEAKPEPKFEIPEDIAEATDGEDPVARQIREAAEQEENPRLREALWEEYRKHVGLKSK